MTEKKRNMGRVRRALATAGVVAGTAALLAAVGGMNIASAVNSLAQYGYGKEKVVVCHKGKKTIRIGAPALKAHLRHGDHVGACTQADRKAAKAKAKAAKIKAAKIKAAKAKAAKAKAAQKKAEQSEAKAERGKAKAENKQAGSTNGKGKGKGTQSSESDSGHGKGKGKG